MSNSGAAATTGRCHVPRRAYVLPSWTTTWSSQRLRPGSRWAAGKFRRTTMADRQHCRALTTATSLSLTTPAPIAGPPGPGGTPCSARCATGRTLHLAGLVAPTAHSPHIARSRRQVARHRAIGNDVVLETRSWHVRPLRPACRRRSVAPAIGHPSSPHTERDPGRPRPAHKPS